MKTKVKPHFILKKNLQKSSRTGVYFSDIVTEEVLKDVCTKITGTNDFTYSYVDNEYTDNFLVRGYNKGRLAILQYNDNVYYISFSENEIGGRNSSVQSVPTAFNMYYLNAHPNKHLCYYFLNKSGNAETDYLVLMYRLMKTIGFSFINENEGLKHAIQPFNSVEDIMSSRKENSARNRSNNSTYITKSKSNCFDVYGKTYGANKYETSMICYALSMLATASQKITLYEVLEGNLKELPASSLEVIGEMGNIVVIPTDMSLEKNEFENNDSLRSPRYIFNLLERLGHKHCALCDCEIPELIQGAHIWSVADIKHEHALSIDQQLQHAISGENGLWLCSNHHKMFDSNLLFVNSDGTIEFKNDVEDKHINYMHKVTTKEKLSSEILSEKFLCYLSKRNSIAV